MENINNRELSQYDRINLEKSLRVLLKSNLISRLEYDELLELIGFTNDGNKIYWNGVNNSNDYISLDEDDRKFFSKI